MDKEELQKLIESYEELEEEEDLEEEPIDMDLDLDDDDEESTDHLKFEFEKLDNDEQNDQEEDDDDDDDENELPKATRWIDGDTCKIVNGVEIRPNICRRGERDDLDLCSICLQPWTMDKVHQMSCLPCGHVYGMSCIKKWMQGRSSHTCPQCLVYFSFKSVRLLYATRLCIPADEKESVRRFPYNKKGFTALKQYQQEMLTNAFKNRSDALKQRAYVLARQNDAMKRRAGLLNRMAKKQKQAEALRCLADAEKQAEALRCVANAEKRGDAEKLAEALRCETDALGQRADEYLQKADALGQHAKALRQQAKASRQRVGAYMATIKFFKQSYKELLGMHNKGSLRNECATTTCHNK